jgi:putative CocE/NonD family hydrolase
VSSHALQRLLKLGPAQQRHLTVTRNLGIPVDTKRTLDADLWAPRGHEKLPTVLVCTPYGRGRLLTALLARPYAERGCQVLLVVLPGTFQPEDKGFGVPERSREDVLAAVRWVVKQPWFGERLILTGPSFLGYEIWSACDALPSQVIGAVLQVTSSCIHTALRGAGFLALDSCLRWCALVESLQRHGLAFSLLLTQRAMIRPALNVHTLADADLAVYGRRLPLYQLLWRHDADDLYWRQWDLRERVARTNTPVSLVGGWQDIFITEQLRDFERLRKAGRPVRMTVGPWTHLAPGVFAEGVRETIARATSQEPEPQQGIRLFVQGSGGVWRTTDRWPPRGAQPCRMYLRHGNVLSARAPVEDEHPDRFRHDPRQPTPSIGGRLLTRGAGRRDNHRLEGRSDVLRFTTRALERDMEVIGEVTVELWLTLDRPQAYLFVSLCDVDGKARSTNVCDGFTQVRLSRPGVVVPVRLALSPTACRFPRGHRLRLQVSGGAFPRYAGSRTAGRDAAPTASNTILFHDLDRASFVQLPVVTAEDP